MSPLQAPRHQERKFIDQPTDNLHEAMQQSAQKLYQSELENAKTTDEKTVKRRPAERVQPEPPLESDTIRKQAVRPTKQTAPLGKATSAERIVPLLYAPRPPEQPPVLSPPERPVMATEAPPATHVMPDRLVELSRPETEFDLAETPEYSMPVAAEPLLLETVANIESLSETEVGEGLETTVVMLPTEGENLAVEPPAYENFVQDTVIELTPELGAAEINQFQVYLAEQPVPETIADIETVILAANQQPLAAVLVQLGQSLAETAAPTEDYSELTNAITEVVTLASRSPATRLPDGEAPILPTPELAQKLFSLLEIIGYDNPNEVLTTFLAHDSLEFLIQAIQYLYQLLDGANQQESLPDSTLQQFTAANDQAVGAYLGKALIQSLFSVKPVSEFQM